MKPNDKNFCGGNYQDWLEVLLTEKCNGRCSWCIERDGFHPDFRADWRQLVLRIMESGKKNIMLLGGEPTLYPYLSEIVRGVSSIGLSVRITTNGHCLSGEYVRRVFHGIKSVNISIHNHDLAESQKITGIPLEKNRLAEAILAAHEIGSKIRFNCNCIKGHIDSRQAICDYVSFAKEIGADAVRISELKNDDTNFVNVGELFGYCYGLNKDPYLFGCSHDVELSGISVNFRQMCGLHTGSRIRPENPEQCWKTVLYYDGVFYKGWQLKKEDTVKEKELNELLKKVAAGSVKPEDAAKEIKSKEGVKVIYESSSGCMY